MARVKIDTPVIVTQSRYATVCDASGKEIEEHWSAPIRFQSVVLDGAGNDTHQVNLDLHPTVMSAFRLEYDAFLTNFLRRYKNGR